MSVRVWACRREMAGFVGPGILSGVLGRDLEGLRGWGEVLVGRAVGEFGFVGEPSGVWDSSSPLSFSLPATTSFVGVLRKRAPGVDVGVTVAGFTTDRANAAAAEAFLLSSLFHS